MVEHISGYWISVYVCAVCVGEWMRPKEIDYIDISAFVAALSSMRTCGLYVGETVQCAHLILAQVSSGNVRNLFCNLLSITSAR